MFLLPPVPGLPVYVFSGFIVAGQLKDTNFYAGAAMGCALSFTLKLSASLGQYFIGLCMGQSVKIQQAVGVNTIQIRAVEDIVACPTLSMAKMLILVAGPDWPTSVLCGVLRVNIMQMMIGTAPVIFVTTPCSLAGAFLAKTIPGQPSINDTLTTFFTGLSAIILVISACAAMLEITKVIERKGDELEAFREDHRAVMELTEQEEEYNQVYSDQMEFDAMGCIRKGAIILASLLLCGSTSVLATMSSQIFNRFSVGAQIDWPIEQGGLDGDWLNIVIRPRGVYVLGCFGVGVVLHLLVAFDAQCRTDSAMKGGHGGGSAASRPSQVEMTVPGVEDSEQATASVPAAWLQTARLDVSVSSQGPEMGRVRSMPCAWPGAPSVPLPAEWRPP